jgi:hypothetical protein
MEVVMLDILRVFVFVSVLGLFGLVFVAGEKHVSYGLPVEGFYEFEEGAEISVVIEEIEESFFADAEITVPVSFVLMADLEINVIDERLAQNCSINWSGSVQNEAACCV